MNYQEAIEQTKNMTAPQGCLIKVKHIGGSNLDTGWYVDFESFRPMGQASFHSGNEYTIKCRNVEESEVLLRFGLKLGEAPSGRTQKSHNAVMMLNKKNYR